MTIVFTMTSIKNSFYVHVYRSRARDHVDKNNNIEIPESYLSWWRHQMETFSAILAICAGNSPVPGDFPTQRPVTRSFDVYFDLRPNQRLSKQSRGWWVETLSPPLWRHRNGKSICAWIRYRYSRLFNMTGQILRLWGHGAMRSICTNRFNRT